MSAARRRVVHPTGESGNPAPGAGVLGFNLFLASLSIFFAASLIGYLVVRLRAETWPPPGSPALPAGLWLSTVLVLCASASAQWAYSSIRKGRQAALRWGLVLTAAVGVAFLGAQVHNWLTLWNALPEPAPRDPSDLLSRADPRLFGFTFYVLTGLHAVHILGGLVQLAAVSVLGWLRSYTWANYMPVRHAAVYWHFLAVVWLVMFAVLYLAG